MASYSTEYVPCSKRQKTLPKSVSSWTRETLESLAIFYDDKTTDISFFEDQLKTLNIVQRDVKLSTNLIDYIKSLVKKLFTLSVDTEDDFAVKLDIIEDYERVISDIEKFNKSVKEMRESMREEHKANTSLVELFESCCVEIRDFYKFFLRFLNDCLLNDIREGLYTQLFMKFTKMFLMDPEPGDLSAERKVQVLDTDVSSIPDVLFFLSGVHARVTTMVMSSEVKEIGLSCSGEKTFPTSVEDSKVLGQHGGQLLAEISQSVFGNKVLGSICMKTKIIFTLLDMKKDHIEQIKSSGNLDTNRGIIYISRPYDFLKSDDRDKILELFALLGFVQSRAYQYLK
ncbi:uncharacterized protein [Argopecten irradians]|uniref:uncharacterized protein n=1 Tax=Argopecten irradians TaxID=31199 RepID=UPI003713323C